ncbi:retention module-containing protein, partial [Marinomonas dokdonensis]|uniref:retention module-containing protein n=1 Tax=Marinomonas dokdonensis TaxID=328224 RepID=UPI004055803C
MSDNQTPATEVNVKPIGYLAINDGSVEVQSANGEVRTVEDGGVIFFGDVIVANNTSGGKIVFFDGVTEDVEFGPGDVVDINGEVYNQEDLDALAQESAAEAQALQDAILAGEDPSQTQEAPAAGEESGEYDNADSVDVSITRNQSEASIGTGFDTSDLPIFGYDTNTVYTARVSFTYNGAESETGSRFGISTSLSSIDSDDDTGSSSSTSSSSSSSTSSTDSATEVAEEFTGYFVDGLVNGLTYTTSSGLTGLTGADGDDGSFRYHEGDTITFSVGGVIVGSVTSDEIDGDYLFLQDVAGVDAETGADIGLDDLNYNYVENMAIFLQAIQDGLKDSDTDTAEDDGILQTNDLVNLEEVSEVISISQSVRDALENVNLNIETMDKEDLSDLLATLGIEFTRESEIADGLGYNEFETLAMEHVKESIEEFAGDRVPEEFDERAPDIIEFSQGTVSYNFNDVKESGRLEFNASDLANGIKVNQVFSENLVVSNVSLGADFEGLGELVDNGDGTYYINITKEDLTPYDLEGLNFDFTVNDWTASYTESSSVALDLNKSHLSTNISDPVSEGDDYAQFTLSSTLAFDEAQSLNITFTSETLSGELGKQIAEYADDFSMPFEYSTDGGETWLSATLNSVEFIGDVAWPTFGLELPAGASSIEVRIPIFDDVEIEGAEFLDAVITGDNFYDENISIEITDNDTVEATQPVVSIDYVYAVEGQEYAEFTVSLSEPSATDVTIDYDVLGMGATAGEDYENATGTITIPAGQTSAVIQIPIVDDIEVENMEMAFVTLSNVTGDAVLGDMQGSLRIFDNDVAEGAESIDVQLTLDDIASDSIINAVESGAETIAITGSVTGDEYAFASVSLVVNGETYIVRVPGGSVDADGVFSVDVPVSVLSVNGDGEYEVSASVTAFSSDGLQGKDAITADYLVDTVAEQGSVTVDDITQDDKISALEAVSDILVTGKATGGDIKTGDAVKAVINGFTYETVVDENGQWSLDVKGVDLVADTDFTVSVTSSDLAGNTVTTVGESLHSIDQSELQVNFIIDRVTSDAAINSDEASGLVNITGSVQVDTLAEYEGEVTLVINGNTYKGEVTDGSFSIPVSGADLAADPNTEILGSVSVSNIIGQEGFADTTRVYFVDTEVGAPIVEILGDLNSDDVINLDELGADGTLTVTVSVPDDFNPRTDTLSIDGVEHEFTAEEIEAGYVVRVEVEPGDVLETSITDKAGNISTVSTPIDIDVDLSADQDDTALSISVADALTNDAASITVNGVDDDAVSVTVTLSDGGETPVVVTLTEKDSETGEWTFSGVDLTELADGAISISAEVTDAAGNTATAELEDGLTLDTTALAAPTLSLVGDDTADGVFNAAEVNEDGLGVVSIALPEGF